MKDVVCGMELGPTATAECIESNGITFYFCSRKCKDAFEMDPAFFLAEQAAKRGLAMGAVFAGRNPHPEIRRAPEY